MQRLARTSTFQHVKTELGVSAGQRSAVADRPDLLRHTSHSVRSRYPHIIITTLLTLSAHVTLTSLPQHSHSLRSRYPHIIITTLLSLSAHVTLTSLSQHSHSLRSRYPHIITTTLSRLFL